MEQSVKREIMVLLLAPRPRKEFVHDTAGEAEDSITETKWNEFQQPISSLTNDFKEFVASTQAQFVLHEVRCKHTIA
jgi:hypothetical protein